MRHGWGSRTVRLLREPVRLHGSTACCHLAGQFRASWDRRCPLKSRENVCPQEPLHTGVLSVVNPPEEWKCPKCPSVDK